VYGLPTYSGQSQRKFKPQIMLYFREDERDVEADYQPITGEISFRLMSQTETTLTTAYLTQLAQRIKQEFGQSRGYIWRKGKIMYSYTDWDRGYQLQLLGRNEAEIKTLIGKIHDIQMHNPSWSNLNTSQNDSPASAYPTIPPLKNILTKSRRMPRRRPIADVRFQYAVCHVWGLPNPIPLFDMGGYFLNPLVR
jgi:hypothetical protein